MLDNWQSLSSKIKKCPVLEKIHIYIYHTKQDEKSTFILLLVLSCLTCLILLWLS